MNTIITTKLNEDNSIMLKFDSNRTLEVKELYNTNNEF